jgi:hypothetical protein
MSNAGYLILRGAGASGVDVDTLKSIMLKSGVIDLKNQTAIESTIGTDTTRIYTYDDGSSVWLKYQADDNAIETDNTTARMSDVANLSKKAGSPAYWLDDVDDKITLPNFSTSALDPGTGDFAISCIASVDNLNSDQIIAGVRVSADYNFTLLILTTGKIRTYCYGAPSWVFDYISTNSVVSAGENYDIFALYDRDVGVILYVNGESVPMTSTQAMTAVDISLNANLIIGNYVSTWFGGSISGFKTWNVILSQIEAHQIQQSGIVPNKYAGKDGFLPGTTYTTGTFVVGSQYRIVNVGDTDFSLIGAASNTIGVEFTATGVGGGTTGTALAIGCVLNLNPDGIGNTQWTDASGNKLNGTVSGAVAIGLPPNHPDRYATGTFTTNIASGVGTKVIVIPAYYYVESITVDDKGTAAGLSDIEATQETSSIKLITGKAVTTGNKITFKTIADHNVYAVNKNLTFTATGNGSSGMEIIVNFRRQQ